MYYSDLLFPNPRDSLVTHNDQSHKNIHCQNVQQQMVAKKTIQRNVDDYITDMERDWELLSTEV